MDKDLKIAIAVVAAILLPLCATAAYGLFLVTNEHRNRVCRTEVMYEFDNGEKDYGVICSAE